MYDSHGTREISEESCHYCLMLLLRDCRDKSICAAEQDYMQKKMQRISDALEHLQGEIHLRYFC